MIQFYSSFNKPDGARNQRFLKSYTLAVPAWRKTIVQFETEENDEGLSRNEVEELFSDILQRKSDDDCLTPQDAKQLRHDTRLRQALTAQH
ncbi:hypothetical protein MUY35_08160 [Aliiroseovarius sp. S1339]|uniref:hypothetical protein n=1 Tax=Aliiroseovarius sp. S1339 TaxID=2936990 RepID=UPI0020BF4407|nr:hypothetical protein [Aliiroseovarius sp. S1339]MCK8463819.1 hypothetical protein [Aliiroseovarius sp. S1339]